MSSSSSTTNTATIIINIIININNNIATNIAINININININISTAFKSLLDSATQEWEVIFILLRRTFSSTSTSSSSWSSWSTPITISTNTNIALKVAVVDPPFIIQFTDFRLVLEGDKVKENCQTFTF